MSKNKTLATITETDASLYSVKIDVNGHQLIGDEPESFGSKNLGPAPYDLLTASLGECTAMTIRWYAIKKEWPVEKVSVDVTHEKREDHDVFTKKVHIEGEALSDEQLARLHDVANKCPVQKTLLSNIQIDSV